VNLYVNTLSERIPYFILYDFDQYKQIWNRAIDRETIPSIKEYLIQFSKEDIKSVENLPFFCPIYKLENINGPYYNPNLSTWEQALGNIEAWNILISEKTFEVKLRYTVSVNKGPNLKFLR